MSYLCRFYKQHAVALSFILVAAIYIYLLYLNQLFPIILDDCVYSFICGSPYGSWNLISPIAPDIPRIDGWSDIALSQFRHYFQWGGRIVAHTTIQFLLWQGKWLFDIISPLFMVLLIWCIYWLGRGGECSWHFREPYRLVWIFFAIWAFIPDYSRDCLWLTGTVNYLWQGTLQLLFWLPFVRYVYRGSSSLPAGRLMSGNMLIFGLIAGWTNENTVCFFLLWLGYYGWCLYRAGRLPVWYAMGSLGMLAGYMLLILAPGNRARHAIALASGEISGWMMLRAEFYMLLLVFLFQLLLWHYIWRVWLEKQYFGVLHGAGWRLREARDCCLLSLGMNIIMLASPEYPRRAAFLSTIMLIVAASCLIELVNVSGRNVMEQAAHRFLLAVGACYMVVSMLATVYGCELGAEWRAYDDSLIQQAAADGATDVVIPNHNAANPMALFLLSGFHVVYYDFDESPSFWYNHDYMLLRGYPEIGLRRDK